jgi:hypothetical protein
MKRRTCRKNGIRKFVVSLFAVGYYLTIAVEPVPAGEGQPAPDVPGGGSGMIIHIDPQTGVFRRQPAPGTVPLQISPQTLNALSTSHQGLVEVPSSAPGGGIRVDLQGRFQSPLFATVDRDGKVRIGHLHEGPAAEPGR